MGRNNASRHTDNGVNLAWNLGTNVFGPWISFMILWMQKVNNTEKYYAYLLPRLVNRDVYVSWSPKYLFLQNYGSANLQDKVRFSAIMETWCFLHMRGKDNAYKPVSNRWHFQLLMWKNSCSLRQICHVQSWKIWEGYSALVLSTHSWRRIAHL